MEQHVTYQDIVQSLAQGILVVDRQGRLDLCNDRAESILQMDLQGKRGCILADILPNLGSAALQCLASGKPVGEQQVFETGQELVAGIRPIRDKTGVAGALISLQLLAAVESSFQGLTLYSHLHRQLETIFEASSDGIWVCDGNGVVISINRASAELNGISKAEVVGRTIEELLAGGIFDQSVTSRVMAAGKRQTVMQHVPRTGRSLLVTGTPSLDSSGRIDLIVVNERDMTELNSLREQFEANRLISDRIREELSERTLLELARKEIVAESAAMRQILIAAHKLARFGASNILVLGESGTGKGLISKLIHQQSERAAGPFIEINCAALPESLLEAELFGYEKGAFTGAGSKGKIGLIELAGNGTLFLDEIGDMPVALQVKLLKYLDDGTIRRIGGTASIHCPCTIIAATNRDLVRLVREKQFREDLYYRLQNFSLEIPPLRDRREDLPGLVRFYLDHFNRRYNCSRTISHRAMSALLAYAFPGNVRELKNIIENAVVMTNSPVIEGFARMGEGRGPEGLDAGSAAEGSDPFDLNGQLAQVERQILLRARACCRTTREMGALLGISQPTVVRKLKRHGLSLVDS